MSLTLLTLASAISSPVRASGLYSYLDDADLTVPPAAPAGAPANSQALATLPFPHMSLSKAVNLNGPDYIKFAKYKLICQNATGLVPLPAIKTNYPQVMVTRYYSPRAYQGSGELYGKQNTGVPFWSTGSNTDPTAAADYSMFAGHWLYKAGTRTTAAIINATTNDVTVTVLDGSLFTTNQYAVIYDDEPLPARQFGNAEHLLVLSKTGNTLTLSRSSLSSGSHNKSAPHSHAANSIIAQHVLGQGSDNQLWAYNVSTECPLDGNSNRLAQIMASWLASHYNLTSNGKDAGFTLDGVVYDVDI